MTTDIAEREPVLLLDAHHLLGLRQGLAANAARYDREGCFPADNIASLRQSGLLALTVPRRYGGGGGELRDASRVLSVLAQGCASTALIVAMQFLKQAALARSDLWPEQVRARIFADAVEHGGLINALRVEPELGSPTRGGLPATTIRRTAQSWKLSGRKIFSTGAPGLRWMDVWARTADEPALVGHVIVPTDAPGISIVETWDHLGMRATCSHDVMFCDVRLRMISSRFARCRHGKAPTWRRLYGTPQALAQSTPASPMRHAIGWRISCVIASPAHTARRSPHCRVSRRNLARSKCCCPPMRD